MSLSKATQLSNPTPYLRLDVHFEMHNMIIDKADRLKTVSEYYFSKKLKEIRAMIADGKQIINLSIGSPDLPPHASVVETLHQTAGQPNNHGYQPYEGILDLRLALSNWMAKTYQVHFSETEILPLMGSKEGITHISMAYLNPGDTVLIPELGYPAYASVARLMGADPIPYPMDDAWHPAFDLIDPEVAAKAKIMWVNYPHMPTGAPASKELFQSIVDFAKRNRVLVCHDNPYSLVLNKKPPLSIFCAEGAKEVCLELNSLSKSHNMAGWRLGWLTGDRALLQHVVNVKSNFDSGMFKGLQEAAITALGLPASWHETRNAEYQARRDLAGQILATQGCTWDTQAEGMFLWGKLPSGKDAAAIVDQMLYDHHVFIAPGFIFGKKGEAYLRISFCASQEKFSEALQRLQSK